MDIEADIHRMVTQYPPLVHDRHHFDIAVNDGVVTVDGHIKGAITFRHLLNLIPNIPGVKSINASELYNDEAIRLGIAPKIPTGLFARVEYGAVILEGTLPEDVSAEELVREVGLVKGVHRVITAFHE